MSSSFQFRTFLLTDKRTIKVYRLYVLNFLSLIWLHTGSTGWNNDQLRAFTSVSVSRKNLTRNPIAWQRCLWMNLPLHLLILVPVSQWEMIIVQYLTLSPMHGAFGFTGGSLTSFPTSRNERMFWMLVIHCFGLFLVFSWCHKLMQIRFPSCWCPCEVWNCKPIVRKSERSRSKSSNNSSF